MYKNIILNSENNLYEIPSLSIYDLYSTREDIVLISSSFKIYGLEKIKKFMFSNGPFPAFFLERLHIKCDDPVTITIKIKNVRWDDRSEYNQFINDYNLEQIKKMSDKNHPNYTEYEKNYVIAAGTYKFKWIDGSIIFNS